MHKYSVYPGEFRCQSCSAVSRTLRCYAETQLLTWMCPNPNCRKLSTVSLKTRKSKKDYERTI